MMRTCNMDGLVRQPYRSKYNGVERLLVASNLVHRNLAGAFEGY